MRAADVVAVSKLVCYCLTSTHFKDLLGSVEDFWRYEALQKVGCALGDKLSTMLASLLLAAIAVVADMPVLQFTAS